MSEKNNFKLVAYKNALDIAFIDVPSKLKTFSESYSLETIDNFLLTRCFSEIIQYLDIIKDREIIKSYTISSEESTIKQKLIINYSIQYSPKSEIAVKATVTDDSILLESFFRLVV